jgi:hypothetical protein
MDWNIISYLKLPSNTHIVDFINEQKKNLLFLYSPAHFQDLIKSNHEHPNFQKDLDMLEWLCGKHHIRWENDNFAGLFGTPSYYFDKIKDNQELDVDAFDIEKLFETMSEEGNDIPIYGKLIELWKKELQTQKLDLILDENSLKTFQLFFPGMNPEASIWDLTKALGKMSIEMLQNKQIWLDLRRYIEDNGGRLDVNAGNWKQEDVIKNVDDFIKKISPTPVSFYDYIQISFKERETQATLYELYHNAYLILDLLGFKSDSLPKPTDGLQNITTDADHSFLAQTCDIFVLEDKKMKAKTEALYHYFNIHTTVVNLDEMVSCTEKKIHDSSLVSPQDVIDHLYDKHEEEINHLMDGNITPFNQPLERKLLNFFDFAHFEFDAINKILSITFSKDEYKYCNFLYFTEKEYLLNRIEYLFRTTPDNDDYKAWREQFIFNHEFEIQRYLNEGVIGALWKDEKYAYPLLTMGVRVHIE